jgi:hypothetical protein
MKTKSRPWYSERSKRWHDPVTGRFMSFSDSRPRGGVFEPGEADLDFEMVDLPRSRNLKLETRRAAQTGRNGETQTFTGLRAG